MLKRRQTYVNSAKFAVPGSNPSIELFWTQLQSLAIPKAEPPP